VLAVDGFARYRQAATAGQPDDRILAEWSHRFPGHVAAALHCSFIALLERDGVDQAGQPIQRVGAEDLRPVVLGKLMKPRTLASASSIRQGGQLGDLGFELIGNLVPLEAGHFGILLSKRGGDKGSDDTTALLACIGQEVAREAHPVRRRNFREHLGNSPVPWALLSPPKKSPVAGSETVATSPSLSRRRSLPGLYVASYPGKSPIDGPREGTESHRRS